MTIDKRVFLKRFQASDDQLPEVSTGGQNLSPRNRRFFRPGWLGCATLLAIIAAPTAIAADDEVDLSCSITIDTPNSYLDWRPLAHPKACLCDGIYLPTTDLRPDAQQFEATMDPRRAPIRLEAGKVEFVGGEHATLQDNVRLMQGSLQLRSDYIDLKQSTRSLQLSGQVRLREPGVLMVSESASVDGLHNTVELYEAQYVMHANRIRGSAGSIVRKNDGRIMMTDGVYTRCEPNHNDWQIHAAYIELDPNTGFGKAKHTRLELREVPILYIPYVEFPIDDRRKSGFLWPSITTTDNGGIDLAVPYYINLAPHYDMTYVPRYINTHGLLNKFEGRYLAHKSMWQGGFTFLDNDKMESEEVELEHKRWSASFTESGDFSQRWQHWINYRATSDAAYFRDLGSSGLDINQELQLKRDAGVSFSYQGWQFRGEVEQYQTLATDLTRPYETAPRLDLSYQELDPRKLFEFGLKSQYTFFEHDELPRGQRLYIRPSIAMPIRGAAYQVTPKVSLHHMKYLLNKSNDQLFASTYANQLNSVQQTTIDPRRNVSVSVADFSLDSTLELQRVLGTEGKYLSTIEPRLFYYYADFENQDQLPNFDTTNLAFGYDQLFRDTRFSGYDRIGDANQISLGVTTRLYENDNGAEVLSAGIGQAFYFRDRDVNTGENISTGNWNPQQLATRLHKQTERRYSDIAAHATLQWRQNWRWIGDYIWDPGSDKTEEAGINLQYISPAFNLFNFGYRFKRRPDHWDETEQRWANSDIDQFDISTIFPLAYRWNLIARINYDLTDQQIIEELSGVEYNDCCWKARLIYHRERDKFDELTLKSEADPVEYEYAILLQVEFKGLGGIADGLNKLLDESIAGFKTRDDHYQ